MINPLEFITALKLKYDAEKQLCIAELNNLLNSPTSNNSILDIETLITDIANYTKMRETLELFKTSKDNSPPEKKD